MAGKGSGDAPKSCCPMPALNKSSIVNYYAPLVGTAGYSLLSVNVLNPSLNLGLLSKRNMTNALLVGSVVGTGCYLYSRPHLQTATNGQKLFYAGFGSAVFTFSSILLWAILRSLLPDNKAVGSIAGLASCALLVKSGQSYLSLIDSQIAKK